MISLIISYFYHTEAKMLLVSCQPLCCWPVANLVNIKWCEKSWKITETLANGYLSESTYQELSDANQHGRVLKVFKKFCILVTLTKVASAFKGLTVRKWYYSNGENTVTGNFLTCFQPDSTHAVVRDILSSQWQHFRPLGYWGWPLYRCPRT